MTFAAFNLLFPVVLAIHNIDEYSRYEDFVRAYHSRLAQRITTRRIVRDAAIMLTLTVAMLAGLTYLYQSAFLMMISKIATFALMLNGVGHCALSLKRRTATPGTLSAAALVLPYSVIAVAIMRTGLGDSYSSLCNYAIYGALTIPLATLSFLWIGYGFTRLTAHTQKRE